MNAKAKMNIIFLDTDFANFHGLIYLSYRQNDVRQNNFSNLLYQKGEKKSISLQNYR